MAPPLVKNGVVSFPVPLLGAILALTFLLFFFVFSSHNLYACPCDRTATDDAPSSSSLSRHYRWPPLPLLKDDDGGGGTIPQRERIQVSQDDVGWLKMQLQTNGIPDPPTSPEALHSLRKGINPRTRAQQLDDFLRFKGISHYEDSQEANNHTILPCPGQLLVEEHHSNYGEPWAGGRDVFEFLASSVKLSPHANVLEIGCGTLRVGVHFIRYLNPERYHCLERDDLSLMAAFRYELPAQGLLHKRPMILKGEDMDFSRFGSYVSYDLIYASAVFLHMPDKLVWVGLERLAARLKPYEGRIFVSHNIKFCSRLGGDDCTKCLSSLGLEYVGKHTHDSLLFNHYEIWFEFKRTKA